MGGVLCFQGKAVVGKGGERTEVVSHGALIFGNSERNMRHDA